MIVLASASPRRAELFRSFGVPFSVRAADVDEARIAAALDGGPAARAERLAVAKAQAVAGADTSAVVVGADTVVALGGEVFGKPRGVMDARRMLRALSALPIYYFCVVGLPMAKTAELLQAQGAL